MVVPPGGDRISQPGLMAPLPEMYADERSAVSAVSAISSLSITGPIMYAPGDFIGGKYKLERVLGQGGMGAVWVAKNISLDADIAIKLIRRDRATEEAAARLLTEARAAAKLGHPGIVRVFDFGQTELGDPYLVMELITGESLAAVIKRKKRLDPGIAIQTLLPVAAALAAAHAKGIIHRDLKPDNIMLSSDEGGKLVPKVLDFGIARVLRDDVERHVTMAGEVLGSPDYMSPEQARGEENLDHRTDIWTFSILLYETVTGRRPFDGPNYNALIASIVGSTPVPTHAVGGGDAALWTIIERGLAKDVNARWQSVEDMGVALASWAIERGIQQDISGLSLQTEWLAPKMRRLLTVTPPDPAMLAASSLTPAPAVAREAADANEWKNLRGSRTKWYVAGGVLALAVLIVVARSIFATGSGDTPGTPAAGTESTAVTAAPTPTLKPTTAPSVVPTASAGPTTAPSATQKAAPTTKTTTKKKAPPVPTNIKF